MTSSKERRLLAVMFTDVVGYTALMQRDEEAARIVRRRHRQVLETAVSAHGGDLLQYLGDGSLTMFPSVVEAVRAAVEVQHGLRQEPVVPLRIGIHQGDISYDTQGAYGDSMNVASRIQSLGTAGSILLSAKAHDEIKNQPDISTTSLGEFELKNVEESLEVYAIVSDVLAVPTRSDVLTKIRGEAAVASNITIRLNTALAGCYRIERELGEGGMATVYLADDIKHERKVALKVLKPELAAVVGAKRFLAEIKTTANLQHPHILPLFDSGEADSFVFYVMPYVEGESLREKLDREKQLPVAEAVRIATDVAEALDYAHRHGVIHRDLKPANVLIHDGQPVISDFGIALAVGVIGGDRLTATGLTPGTPHYMSPEQATGDDAVGPATDTYALGCVLHEMLVGEPPYTGSTPQAILGKIIAGEPESVTAQRKSVPLNVDAAISKALEKLPADRFAGAQDFARALADPGFRYGEPAGAGVAPGAGPWNRVAIGFAALAAGLSFALGWSLLHPEAPPAPVARFESPFREGQAPIGPLEMMRDGSGVVYVGPGESGSPSQLWIRNWMDLEARRIPETDGVRASTSAGQLAISPDGREVVFSTGDPGPLRVVALAGGPSRTVAESAYGAAWSRDGWIYFLSGAFVISRVPSTGGEAEVLMELSEGELFHAFPQPLPDGNALLFQVFHAEDGSDAEVWALDLGTGERKMLTLGTSPRFVAPGHLLFGTPDGRLMAAPFDAKTAALTGVAAPVAEGLLTDLVRGNLTYSVSEDGTLVYLAGDGGPGSFEFVWVTRSGEAMPVDAGETFTTVTVGNNGWRLSPDGSRIAFVRSVDGNVDIWIKGLPDGPVSRLTFSDAMDLLPQWAPDGQSVTYRNGPLSDGSLWSMQADGTGEPELVFDEFSVTKGVWSPDGEWLVLRRSGEEGVDETSRDILVIRPEVDTVAVPLVVTVGFREQAPAISRDGRWLAYSSNETGRHEIFVRPFPDVAAGKWQVSVGGGIQPVWAHNGRELFFADPVTRELKAAEFTTTSATFQRARLTTLFEIPAATFFGPAGIQDFYDVALGDERFLMARVYSIGRRRHVAHPGSELLRGAEGVSAELKAQIPWLRVFLEGVVIVHAHTGVNRRP